MTRETAALHSPPPSAVRPPSAWTAGDLFVEDASNNRVREIAAAGSHLVSAEAGTGVTGFAGDGAAATSAQFNLNAFGGSAALATDPSGDLFIADPGNNRAREVFASGGSSVRPVDEAGDVYTVAGNGSSGDSGDGGPAATAEIVSPTAVTADENGNVYVAEDGRMREMAAATGSQFGQSMTGGDVYTIAGTGAPGSSGDGGPASAAQFGEVSGLSVDSSGDIYVADQSTEELREISSTSPFDINGVAGNRLLSDSGDGAPATTGQVDNPGGTGVDRAGDVFFVDGGNNRVRMVAANTCSANCPFGIDTTRGDLYTVAGDGVSGTTGDNGPATAAELDLLDNDLSPGSEGTAALAIDSDGDVLVTDFGSEVRLVAAADCSVRVPLRPELHGGGRHLRRCG